MIHTYGREGLAYPVEVGQVWKVGRHYYACSDLMNHDLMEELLASPLTQDPTVVYTDPPWGQGLANGFRTRAGLDRANYDWTALYRRAADLAEVYDAPLWAECSKADTRIGMAVPGNIGRRTGPTRRGYWDIGYFGGNPSGLYYAHSGDHPPLELTDREGWAVPTSVLSLYYGGVVLDPFSGLGGVPLVAEKVGLASINNELAPHRVSKALSRMSKLTGLAPERVAAL